MASASPRYVKRFSPPLCNQRYRFIADLLTAAGCASFADVGCNEGGLVQFVMSPTSIARPTSCAALDKDAVSLTRVAAKLEFSGTPSWRPAHILLVIGDCCAPDPSFKERVGHSGGFHAVVSTEVVEHLELHQVAAYITNMFSGTFVGPETKLVVLTTPNADYNVRLGLPQGAYRHPDHRFEYTAEAFDDHVSCDVAPVAVASGFTDVLVFDIGGGATQAWVAVRRGAFPSGPPDPSFSSPRRGGVVAVVPPLPRTAESRQDADRLHTTTTTVEYTVVRCIRVPAENAMRLLMDGIRLDRDDECTAHDGPGRSFTRRAGMVPVRLLAGLMKDNECLQRTVLDEQDVLTCDQHTLSQASSSVIHSVWHRLRRLLEEDDEPPKTMPNGGTANRSSASKRKTSRRVIRRSTVPRSARRARVTARFAALWRTLPLRRRIQ